jgi:hypothetical protein
VSFGIARGQAQEEVGGVCTLVGPALGHRCVDWPRKRIEEVSAKTLGPIASGEAARAVPGRRRAKGGREVSPKPSQTHASGALAYRAAAE